MFFRNITILPAYDWKDRHTRPVHSRFRSASHTQESWPWDQCPMFFAASGLRKDIRRQKTMAISIMINPFILNYIPSLICRQLKLLIPRASDKSVLLFPHLFMGQSEPSPVSQRRESCLSKQFFYQLSFFIQNASSVMVVDQDAAVPESREKGRMHGIPQGDIAHIDIRIGRKRTGFYAAV